MPYKDPEAHKANSRKRYHANPEKHRAQSKAWIENNRAAHAESQRRSRFKSRYGLTMQEHKSLVDAQSGCCAICLHKPKRLVVDHDHGTGKVRALLCAECNIGIGMFRDNPGLLNAALEYMRRFG